VRFDVYGRFTLEVVRENSQWVAYKLDVGKRIRWSELIIPSTLDASEIATYLADLFHEMAGPGQNVRVLN
jgi:hypothetical protein